VPGTYFHRFSKLLLLTMLICILLAMPASAYYGEDSLQTIEQSVAVNAGNDYSIVMQVIDGRFHKWLEYENSCGSTGIYMLEPESGFLTAAESALLFDASRRWISGYRGMLTSSSPAGPSTASDYKTVDIIINFPSSNYVLQGMVDNRTAVSGTRASSYPNFNSGFLTVDFNNDYMRGSGFLVTPYVVLTNAHNIYSADFGGWFSEITFSPGQYETVWPNFVAPFGTKKPVLAETNQNYILHENNSARDQSIKYDYAALFFEEPFSGIDTFVPLEFNFTPTDVIVTGYPGVVKDANTMGMWRAEGKLINQDSHCLYYDAYTSGGSSGSPVLSYNSQSDSYRVVAVHSFASPGNFSGGPHLNNLNKETIEKWLQWQPDTPPEPTVMLSLNKSAVTLEIGDKEALIVTTNPATSNNIELNWSSSNENTARVDANGMVTAIAGGRATIRVETADGSSSANCEVTVKTGAGELDDPSIYRIGDINEDGIINVQDVVLAMQHVLMIEELAEEQAAMADANGDGEINVVDVTLLMQFALGLINTF